MVLTLTFSLQQKVSLFSQVISLECIPVHQMLLQECILIHQVFSLECILIRQVFSPDFD
jgi:hypothetical protein